VRAFVALVVGAVLALGAGVPAAAHGPGDGRIPGKPDVHKLGKSVHVYDEDTGNYTVKRPGRPDITMVGDEREELHGNDESGPMISASPGPGVNLPPHQEATWCTNTGNRIVPVWAHAPGTGDPNSPQVIRQNIQRMNWKFMQQSSLSSSGSRVARMVVDCGSSGMTVEEVHTSTNDPLVVMDQVENQFGRPTGGQAVKYLIFFTPCGDTSYGGGATGPSSDPGNWGKNASNKNRTTTTSAIITGDHNCPVYPSWNRHVTIHELLHAMGATQRPTGDPAPFATDAAHCTDGIDVLCYNDSSGPGWYSETRCTEAAGYYSWENVPIDCGYDTYFDAVPEAGEWLDRYWNVGGPENPFLTTSQPYVAAQNSGPRFQAANVTGDGRAEIVGRNWRFDDLYYASPANGFQSSSSVTTWAGSYAPMRVADVTGDGRADVVGRNSGGDVHVGKAIPGGYASSTSWGNWPSSNSMVLGDVSADGRADLVGRDGSGNLRVARSNGTSAFQTASTWGSWDSAHGALQLADVNGDSRQDVVGVSAAGDVRVSLSNGSSFAAPTVWATIAAGSTALFGDVTGDGRYDLAEITSAGPHTLHSSDGSSFSSHSNIAWGAVGNIPPLALADVDGDRRADLIGRSPADADVYVSLGSSSGLGTRSKWTSWSNSYSLDVADIDDDGRADLIGRSATGDVQAAAPLGLGAVTRPGALFGGYAPYTTADVTGDGQADLLGHHVGSGATVMSRVVSTGLFPSMSALASWNPWGGSYLPFRLGDVNGDGRADIVGRNTSTNNVQVGLSTGSAFAGSSSWGTWAAPFELADVTGDGRDDIVGRNPVSGSVEAMPSTGTAFAGHAQWAIWPTAWGTPRYGDVNGDGRDDLVGRGPDGLVRVTLSTGTTFAPAQAWTSWTADYADFQLADMNGDGRADLISRSVTTGDLRVGLSAGFRFRDSSSWGTWGSTMAGS
jgi:hypothetical protein